VGTIQRVIQYASLYKTLWQSVKLFLKYGDFSIFFKMVATVRELAFVMRMWTTHEWHLVIFISVQSLVGIDAVVLIICKF